MEAAESERPLDESERAELHRLRRELARIRERRSAGDPTAPDRSVRPPRHATLRWTAAVLLLIVVAVLGLSSLLARFVRSELLDADRYVQTVAPLGSDPTIQSGLADRVTDAIMGRLDIDAMTAQALTAITDGNPRVPAAVAGLAPVIEQQVRNFVRDTAAGVVASDQFEGLWLLVNQQAHRKVVAVLTGETRAGVEIDDNGTVSVSLGPIIDRVRAALIERGFTVAERVPAIDPSFVVMRSPELVKTQHWVSLLDRAANILPWVAVLAAAGAVWVAPKGARRQVFSLVGVTLAAAMALSAVAIAIGRAAYLRAIPADVVTPQVAMTVIDTVLVPLRSGLRAVFVLAVVVALAGYLSGSSRSAVALRAAYRRRADAMRARRADRVPRPIESALWRYRIPLRVGILAAAAATLIFWPYPTGPVVIATVVVAVAALLALELMARPAARA